MLSMSRCATGVVPKPRICVCRSPSPLCGTVGGFGPGGLADCRLTTTGPSTHPIVRIHRKQPGPAAK